MENNKIYGVDKYANLYIIDILLTYTDEIVGNITNFNNEIKRVEFYLEPQQDSFYKIKGCSNPKFDYIWKDRDVVCSFCKDDIIAIKSNLLNEYYDKEIQKIEGKIKDLESKHSNISYERFNFEKLDLQDEVILYSKYINRIYKFSIIKNYFLLKQQNFNIRQPEILYYHHRNRLANNSIDTLNLFSVFKVQFIFTGLL